MTPLTMMNAGAFIPIPDMRSLRPVKNKGKFCWGYRSQLPHIFDWAIYTLNKTFSFSRAIAECFAHLSHGLGICPSVRPSVALLYCVKTVQARITKFLPWTAVSSLSWQNFVRLVRGFPSNEGIKEGYPL